jgi:hypothetical protein
LPSRIVQNPRLWPTSFAKPVISQQTCIRIYFFNDGTKVEKFLDFVKQSFPNRKVDIKQLEDGKVSVSITSAGVIQLANNDSSNICEYYCNKLCVEHGGCEGDEYNQCVSSCLR